MMPGALGEKLRDEGFCVAPEVLTTGEVAQVRLALDQAIDESRRRGIATYTQFLDPNPNNVRVYNLPDFDPIFVELLRRPIAIDFVREVLGQHFIVSSFTANIALPGSGSMNIHSDQALAVPPPWNEPWAINILWCLDDVHDRNGATRYVPGSHYYRTFEDVPPDAMERSRPFEAKAGSMIVVDGRLWHTSGKNVTADEQRALLFAYYVKDFVRPQANHEASLSPETKARLDDEARVLLGLGPAANVRIGAELTSLATAGALDPNRQYTTNPN